MHSAERWVPGFGQFAWPPNSPGARKLRAKYKAKARRGARARLKAHDLRHSQPTHWEEAPDYDAMEREFLRIEAGF